jgi:hypothetical protein
MTPEQQELVEAWAEMCYRYKHRWIRYLTSLYGEHFNREFGAPFRISVENPEDVYRYIGFYNRNRLKPAFISVNGYKDREDAPDRRFVKWRPKDDTVTVTRAFYDFDGGADKGFTIDRAREDALTVYRQLDTKFPNDGREVRFSGSKGFAVELKRNMSLTELSDLNREISNMQVPTLDRVTNSQQIYRIPYSLHQTSLRQVIPIKPEWDMETIVVESRRFRPPPVVMG